MQSETTLSRAAIQAWLSTSLLGREVEYYPSIGSTNDLLAERARAGAPEGLLVVAGEQTAGRGRLDRTWTAPAGSSILASLLLRPRLVPGEMLAPTMIFGLAVQQAVLARGVPAGLKWPNDVLVGERKLAGILCEAAVGTNGVGKSSAWVVAGFGVNVNFDPADYGLGEIATSISRELGRAVDLGEFLAGVLREAESRYLAWQAGGYEEVWREWRANLLTLGRGVRVEMAAGRFVEGVALDVARDGALIVGAANGEERVVSGVVELLPERP